MFPEQIKVQNKKILYIKWDDGSESKIKLANLRRNCPCALCNSDREKQGMNYIPLYNENEITIENVNVIGYYALSLSWKDGHKTGIYEFERLKNLAEK